MLDALPRINARSAIKIKSASLGEIPDGWIDERHESREANLEPPSFKSKRKRRGVGLHRLSLMVWGKVSREKHPVPPR
jgi:hypothetical protein